MPYEQCRAINPLGARCTMTAAPESEFCRFHSREGAPSIPGGEPRTEPSPTGRVPEAAEGLEWLQVLLRQAMTEVMAGEATPLQKASAIARLGNLYLKAHGSAELKRANKELLRQTAALEERLAAAEARLAALAAAAPAVDAPSTAAKAISAPPRAAPGDDGAAVLVGHEEPARDWNDPGERSPGAVTLSVSCG